MLPSLPGRRRWLLALPTLRFRRAHSLLGKSSTSITAAIQSTDLPSSSSFTVTVTGLTPTVPVIPSKSSLLASDSMTVQATVTGTGATPTGKVTLFGVGFFGAGQQLSNGSYSFTVPDNSFYGYNNRQRLPSVTAAMPFMRQLPAQSILPVTPVYALSATAPAAITAGGTASSTVTVSSVSGYVGTVNLSCVLTSSASGATVLPTC